jgi:hypothetical protein
VEIERIVLIDYIVVVVVVVVDIVGRARIGQPVEIVVIELPVGIAVIVGIVIEHRIVGFVGRVEIVVDLVDQLELVVEIVAAE